MIDLLKPNCLAKRCSLCLLVLVALATSLSGCYELYAPPGVKVIQESRKDYVDPDAYQVKSNEFPTYKVKQIITDPPRQSSNNKSSGWLMVEILPSDTWKVTHVYKKYRLLFSEDYQKRQVDLLEKLDAKQRNDIYLFHLPIDADGRVQGGWVPLKNLKVVVFKGDRRQILNPEYWKNPEWTSEPLFFPTQ